MASPRANEGGLNQRLIGREVEAWESVRADHRMIFHQTARATTRLSRARPRRWQAKDWIGFPRG